MLTPMQREEWNKAVREAKAGLKFGALLTDTFLAVAAHLEELEAAAAGLGESVSVISAANTSEGEIAAFKEVVLEYARYWRSQRTEAGAASEEERC